MKSKIINLTFASLLGVSSLLMSGDVLVFNNRVIAQTIKPNIGVKQLKKSCQDATLKALHKKLDELITRISLSITYPEFRTVFIDAKLIEKDLKELPKTHVCYSLQSDLTLSLKFFEIGNRYWELEMDGTDFLPVDDNILIEFLLKQLPDMETVLDGRYLRTDNAVKGYFDLGRIIVENTEI
ncbi:MAG: hypothetical protein RLZZ184_4079 [Cyanobacteriota bacterium]|jgi:hypothetical protein